MTKVLPHNVHLNMNKYIAKMASNMMTKVIYFDDVRKSFGPSKSHPAISALIGREMSL